MVMLASTKVLFAGPEPFGPDGIDVVAGSVSRTTVSPARVSVTDALPTTLPPLADVNTMSHWPLPSVTPSQVVGGFGDVTCTAPFESVSVYVTATPAAGVQPVPGVWVPVTVN